MKFNNLKKPILIWALIFGIVIPALVEETITPQERLTDGPYVFYLNNKIIACSLKDGQSEIKEYETGKRIQLTVPAVKRLTVDIPVELPQPSQDIFENVEYVFAISDVHGQFYRMKDILIGNRIMDEDYNWTFKNGHLVLVGDVFDRGPMVTECLWLLYRLDQQSLKVGGKVHMLLGNHDQMVIREDLRYVHKRYKKISRKLKRIRYPDLFGPDTVLGQWLRSRQAVIQINDILYVHAGIHPRFVDDKITISDINRTMRQYLDEKSYVVAFDLVVSFMFGRNGVFWCRGYFNIDGYDPISKDQLANILDFYKASHVVVGHTRFDHVRSYVGGLVLGTAVNTEEDKPAEGLMIKKGRFFNADAEGHLKEIGISVLTEKK